VRGAGGEDREESVARNVYVDTETLRWRIV
jgi:hypothetical protein